MSIFTEDEIVKMVEGDTKRILRMEYSRLAIGMGVEWWESPIFDSLAADRFARDRPVNPFNLGDYR